MPYQYYPQYGMQYTQPMPDQLTQLRQQQYQQPLMQQAQPTQQPSNSIIWVQNQQEAFNYMVAPNCAVALWDSNSPVVYLKQADASGKPSIKIFDLVERTQTNSNSAQSQNNNLSFASKEEFEKLKKDFESLKSKITSVESKNNKSN